jgi:hypothetical protein
MKAFQMREDYCTAPLSECYLQYYYDIPCPTYSWFWGFSGFIQEDYFGAVFDIGDMSTGTGLSCDPAACHTLEKIRILDFAGYGTLYPGWFSVQMEVYCTDELDCLVGPPLWTSGPLDFHIGWNYIEVSPQVCLTPCSTVESPLPSAPRILVLANLVGTVAAGYPVWGFDNISTPFEQGCPMHDTSCLPALFPRPAVSHYDRVHTGYYGYESPTRYCPPLRFHDGRDTTPNGSQFGFVELAWRIYLGCTGPTAAEPSTWGSIKSIYR